MKQPTALAFAAAVLFSSQIIGCGGNADDLATSSDDLRTSDDVASGAIEKAISGLSYLSESDSKFAYATSTSTRAVSATAVRALFEAQILAEATAQNRADEVSFNDSHSVTASTWFAQNATDPDPSSDDAAGVKYYAQMAALGTTLEKEMTNLHVYRFGGARLGLSASADVAGPVVVVAIVGKLPSGALGCVFTFSVET